MHDAHQREPEDEHVRELKFVAARAAFGIFIVIRVTVRVVDDFPWLLLQALFLSPTLVLSRNSEEFDHDVGASHSKPEVPNPVALL